MGTRLVVVISQEAQRNYHDFRYTYSGWTARDDEETEVRLPHESLEVVPLSELFNDTKPETEGIRDLPAQPERAEGAGSERPKGKAGKARLQDH